MIKRIERFFDKIFDNKIFRTLSVYVVGMLLFYMVSSAINSIISKYFVIEEGLLLSIPKFLVVVLFLIIVVYVIYKLTLKKYQTSTSFTHTLLVVGIVYLMLRWVVDKKGWDFIPFTSRVMYIDFLGLLLFLSIILIGIGLLNRKKPKKKSSLFIADDPIVSEEQEKLDYGTRADKIIEHIKKSNFERSFSIGIVGPWGNGKSSLIGRLESKLNEQLLEDTIHLKFLPYLNHNDNDIITEFFTQLSTEIGKYSGKLSNQFLTYSNKLIKLYKDRNIIDFFKSNTNKLSSVSSFEMYNKIDKTLNEINKKFIVFVDDLDRLTNNEILQVLKLVRNTANFRNFIFIIALDKDYVLGSLMDKNDIADHAFIDKFFQLEIYLPEIEKSQLKRDFVELLEPKLDKPFFVRDVKSAIYKKENLFDDYIFNYRGVKRLLNQVIFDYKLLPDELNANDFLNFTYLKMTFPSVIKYLYVNRDNVIPQNPETKLRELIENKEDGNGKSDKENFKEMIQLISKHNTQFIPKYEKYDITKGLKENDEVEEWSSLKKQQYLLLAKTLIALFGKENKTNDYTSIKFGDNVRKLLQQKVMENDMTNTEFESIFNIEDDFKSLSEIIDKGQINEVLDRLAFYNTSDLEKGKQVTIILLHIYASVERYGAYDYTVWKILLDFILRVNEPSNEKGEIKNKKEELWKAIKEGFFDKEDYKEERKLDILSKISENRIRLSFDDWGTSEETLKSMALDLYKALLKKKQGAVWDIHDYSFYHAYHNVRRFQDETTINQLTIDFWKNNDITLLCAQMVENDSFTAKMIKTSDFVLRLFGSKKKYKEFIERNTPTPTTPDIKEYLNFLRIESFTGFSMYIRFDFKCFDLINQRLDKSMKSNNIYTDDMDNVVQFVFESSTEALWEAAKTNIDKNKIPGLLGFNWYNVDGYHTFFQVETKEANNVIINLLKHFQKELNNKNIQSEISSDGKTLEVSNSNDKIEKVSSQPNSY